MIIPGIVISVITFPGVIVHEFAHFIFCRLLKVPVFEVKFFQFDMQTTGYVIHEKTEEFHKTFLISFGPFLINTLLCLLICLPTVVAYHTFEEHSVLNFFLLWLGISIGMHAFPSTTDSKIVLSQAAAEIRKFNILAIISIPLFTLFFLASILSIIWFDAIYGLAIGLWIPSQVLNALL